MSKVLSEDVIRRILEKPVSELTEEDKAILREWFLKHRSKYSLAVDLRRASKKTPVYTATWYHRPGRYDIPGVDTPEALPQYQKLGYKPRHRKKKTSYKQALEDFIELYDLGKLMNVYPEITKNIINGFNIMVNEPSKALKIIETIAQELDPIYYSLIKDYSKASTPMDRWNLLKNYGSSILVPILYLIGKGVDVSDLKNIRRYANQLVKKLKNTYKDVWGEYEPYTGFLRILRSKDILNNVLPAILMAEVLLSDKVRDIIKNNNQILYDILNKTYYKREAWGSRYTKYYAEPPLGFMEDLIPLITTYNHIVKAVEDPEYMYRLLHKLGLEKKMDGVELRFGKNVIEVYFNGEKLGDVKYDKEYLLSRASFDGDIEYVLLHSVVNDIINTLEKHEIYIDSNKDNTQIYIYRFSKDGMELLYPMHKLYPYSDLEKVFKELDAWKIDIIFKKYAEKYGYKYPSKLYAVSVKPISIGNTIINLYKVFDRNTKKFYYEAEIHYRTKSYMGRGDTEKDALLSLAEDVARQNKSLAQKILEYIKEKYGIESKVFEKYETALKLAKLIGEELGEIEFLGYKAYMDPAHIIVVIPYNNEGDVEKILNGFKFEKAVYKGDDVKYYIEYSGWEGEVKELADILKKHNVPYKLVDKETILIPYGSISITRLGKLYREFKYRKPYQIVLAVEYPDGETAKFSYLYKILSSLGKPEKIYTSKTDKKYSPIILKYPYYIIAIAPRTG